MELVHSGVKLDFEPPFFCLFDLLEVFLASTPCTSYFIIKIVILPDILYFCHVIANPCETE